MRTKKLTILVATVILLNVTNLDAEEKTKLTSNTCTASCLVKVTIDPAILPLNYDNIEYLLQSSAIAGKAGREVLNISHNEAAKLLEVIPLAQSANLSTSSPTLLPLSTSSPTLLPTDKEYQDEMMMMMQEMGMGMQQPRFSRRSQTDKVETMDRTSNRTRRRETRDSRERGRRRSPRRTTRTTAPAKSPTSTGDRPFLFQLIVELPDEVQPLAEEFLTALTDNLRQTLKNAHRTYLAQLINDLEFAQSQRDNTQAQLSDATEQAPQSGQDSVILIEQDPADTATYRQLEEIVDLSQLTPEMAFSEAIEELKNAVAPPLQVIVLWRDLIDNADIDQTTPINMDAISAVPLKRVLQNLLKSVSGGLAELGYTVENGVITIATKDSLPARNLETRVYDISGLVHPAGGIGNLSSLILHTIEPDSWFGAGGEGTFQFYQGRKLVVRQIREIHQKIPQFLQSIKTDIPTDIPVDISVDILLDKKQDLLQEKQELEMEVASLNARHSAIEQQIAKISKDVADKVKDDPITIELQGIVDGLTRQLVDKENLLKAGRSTSAELEEMRQKLARARIELAKRREELSKSFGGDQLAQFNKEYANSMVELAEKTAMLNIATDQLRQTEQQLTAATTFYPRLSRMRTAREAFEIADSRVNQLEILAANLQPPTVTVLGVN